MGQVCGCVFRVVGVAYTSLAELQQPAACSVLWGSEEEYVHSPERHCALPGPAAVCGPPALCGEPEGGKVPTLWLVQAGLWSIHCGHANKHWLPHQESGHGSQSKEFVWGTRWVPPQANRCVVDNVLDQFSFVPHADLHNPPDRPKQIFFSLLASSIFYRRSEIWACVIKCLPTVTAVVLFTEARNDLYFKFVLNCSVPHWPWRFFCHRCLYIFSGALRSH